jgi:hypothetical protein
MRKATGKYAGGFSCPAMSEGASGWANDNFININVIGLVYGISNTTGDGIG